MQSIIQKLELKVSNAMPGEKVYTFRYFVFMYAENFISNNIRFKDIKNICPSLDNTSLAYEYSRTINYYKFLQNKKYKVNFCNTCKKMIDLSYDTWERIKFVRRSTLPLKVKEVTITENLLFELNKYLDSCANREIEIFEAVSEKVNGNDIELFIQQSNGKYIHYPLQAKILDSKMVYNQIPYYTGTSSISQTQKLIVYAKKTGGIPLYLLYNFNPKYDSKLNKYGCSIVDANYINMNHSIKNPSFDDFHINLVSGQIVASPWYVLVCNEHKDTSLTSNMINTSIKNIKNYNKSEIIDYNEWKSISMKEAIYELDESDGTFVDKSKLIEDDSQFLSKYRIIVSNQIKRD